MEYGLIRLTSRDKSLKCEYENGFQHRCTSTILLFQEAYELSEKPDFDIAIFTGDRISDNSNYNYSVINRDYSKGIPDFTFDYWPEVGISKYEQMIDEIKKAGEIRPLTNNLGWIGSLIGLNWHPRDILYAKSKNDYNLKDLIDIRAINWNSKDPNNLTKYTENYMSIPEQVKNWRFLIDIEGVGWSARTKYLFWSNRVVFLVKRSFEEYWYENLKPWVHYVPVDYDFSDLYHNIMKVSNNPSLENSLIKNAHNFANTYLRRQNAIDRFKDIINSYYV